MQPKLFVGNLSYQTSEEDLKTLFSEFGTVVEASVIRDRSSGQSKGFGFVLMGTGEEAEKALTQDGQDFMGRRISVSEAKPPKKDFGGGSGGGGPRKSYGDRGGDRGDRGNRRPY